VETQTTPIPGRLELQQRLDGGKSPTERNVAGQFATPDPLAREIVAEGIRTLSSSSPIRFLDPAFGLGAFYEALRAAVPPGRLESAVAYEIDPHYGEPARTLWADAGIDIRIEDFTRTEPEAGGFDLVVCNPPYVRHHHLPGRDKVRLQDEFERRFQIRPSGRSGLYCYFLMMSKLWMAEEGIGVWLVPGEFMDVNYGRQVKEFLLEQVELVRIHRADPGDLQFSDALVSSAVVVFRNRTPRPDHRVAFTFGGSLERPAVTTRVAVRQLAAGDKWTRYPAREAAGSGEGVPLGDLFEIKRGIATGNNKFFIRSRRDWSALGVAGRYLHPILPSPRYLTEMEILAGAGGHPRVKRPLFLFDCRTPIEGLAEPVAAFIAAGAETVARGYLCGRRTPWYAQEKRDPAPLLCTYMGRARESNGGKPFRFLLNHSAAIATNVYLMLYPKDGPDGVAAADRLRSVWEQLGSMDAGELSRQGRVYGGGLYKLEPAELSRVRIRLPARPSAS